MRKLKIEELNRVDVATFQAQDKIPVVVVCDNIRSMYNVGSIFRTCDAFAVEKVYLCGITAKPPHKEIRKTALGATESVEWEYVADAKNLIMQLIENQYVPIAIEQVDHPMKLDDFQVDTDKKYVLIFGNEVKGVSQEVVNASDTVLEIPQFGTKHSLNISVSAGVVVWDLWSKQNAKK